MRGLRILALLLVVLLDPLGLAAQGPGGAKDRDTRKDPAPTTSPGMSSGPLLLEGRTVSEWAKDLTKEDPSVREEAIRAMMFFGKEASTDEIVQLLLYRTLDTDLSPKLRALQALSVVKISDKMWPQVLRHVNYRLSALDEPQVVIRAQASLAMCSFGPKAAPSLSYLIRGAGDGGSWEIRRACVHALGVVGVGPKGDPDPKTVTALVARLQDKALQVRMEAIYSLGALGMPADPAQRLLVQTDFLKLAKNKDTNVAIWAALSLMVVTNAPDIKEKVKATVREHLKHTDPRVRATAARGLGHLGNDARFAVADLDLLLKDPEPSVVVAAITTIAGIDDPGIAAKAGLQAIIDSKEVEVLENKKNTHEYIKKLAQAALDRINKKPPPAKKP